MNSAAVRPAGRSRWFWAGLMMGSFAAIAGLRMSDAIGETTGFVLMCGAMVLIVPLVRASLARQRETGHLSPAVVRYTRRFMAGTFGYVLGLGVVLAAGSFWGFLETFGVVPHVWAWWTFPVWAIGMGLSQGWMAWRDRTAGDAA